MQFQLLACFLIVDHILSLFLLCHSAYFDCYHTCIDVHVMIKNLVFLLPVLNGYQLSPREHVVSVTSCALGCHATPMFAVGTAFVDPTEKEPNRGRTMLFRATHTSMHGIIRSLDACMYIHVHAHVCHTYRIWTYALSYRV